MQKFYPIELFHWAGMTDQCIDDLKVIIQEAPELINSITQDGDNALIIASRVNNIKIVEYLIEETTINRHQSGHEGNAFLVALKANNTKIALYLAKHANSNLTLRNQSGKTAFHHAALNGNDDIVEFLLEQNLDVNLLDYDQQNVLFDLLTNYTSHKNYWCFELLQSNMNDTTIAQRNVKGVNIIDHMHQMIEDSTNIVQKAARKEYYKPLENLLLQRM
jgi:ankyrin repeat protein